MVGKGSVVSGKSFVKNLNRLIEEVCCTAQCDGNFVERLPPSPLLEEILKTTVMFIHDRLLRVKHQTIGGCHSGPFYYLVALARHQILPMADQQRIRKAPILCHFGDSCPSG